MNFKLSVNRKINTKYQQNYLWISYCCKLAQRACNHRKENERSNGDQAQSELF